MGKKMMLLPEAEKKIRELSKKLNDAVARGDNFKLELDQLAHRHRALGERYEAAKVEMLDAAKEPALSDAELIALSALVQTEAVAAQQMRRGVDGFFSGPPQTLVDSFHRLNGELRRRGVVK